jgi:NAD(P)-dependent dehydrogenase (short-subunit alcohol dehydrogenase family)
MDLGLEGRTAVVTGASRGIGLAITRGLAAHGARVVAGARRSSAELDQLAEKGQVQVLEVDLADPGGPGRLVALAGNGVAQAVSHATGAKAGDVAREAAKAMVTGRFSRPEEVADLVLLLASDRTANVTGSDFRIDGGLIPTW